MRSPNKTLRVLGVDPGYDRLGLAVVEGDHSTQRLLYSTCATTEKDAPFPERLVSVIDVFENVLRTHNPDAVSLETLFVTKNQKTAMRVAEVRGALIYIAQKHKRPVYEYAPQQVKSAASGHGRNTKQDVALMLHRLLSIPKKKMLDDEYDAIAVALTHIVSREARREN